MIDIIPQDIKPGIYYDIWSIGYYLTFFKLIFHFHETNVSFGCRCSRVKHQSRNQENKEA